MNDPRPPFASDEFVQQIAAYARTSGTDIALRFAPADIEVIAYALRELVLMANPDIKVAPHVPERARVFLEGLAKIAGVNYRPLTSAPTEF